MEAGSSMVAEETVQDSLIPYILEEQEAGSGQEVGLGYKTSRPAPTDLLLPAGLCLLQAHDLSEYCHQMTHIPDTPLRSQNSFSSKGGDAEETSLSSCCFTMNTMLSDDQNLHALQRFLPSRQGEVGLQVLTLLGHKYQIPACVCLLGVCIRDVHHRVWQGLSFFKKLIDEFIDEFRLSFMVVQF